VQKGEGNSERAEGEGKSRGAIEKEDKGRGTKGCGQEQGCEWVRT